MVKWGMTADHGRPYKIVKIFDDLFVVVKDGTFEVLGPQHYCHGNMRYFEPRIDMMRGVLRDIRDALKLSSFNDFGAFRTLDLCCGGGDDRIFFPILPGILGTLGANAHSADVEGAPRFASGLYTHYQINLMRIKDESLGNLVGTGFDLVTMINTLGRGGDYSPSLARTAAEAGMTMRQFQDILVPQVESILAPNGLAYIDTLDEWGRIIRK